MQPQEDARACLQELQQKPPVLPFEPDLLPMLLKKKKNSTATPAKGLVTEIECETRGEDHLDRLMEALRGAGYDVKRVELD